MSCPVCSGGEFATRYTDNCPDCGASNAQQREAQSLPPVGKDADLIERLRTRANVYAERREISMEALLLKAADRLSVMEEALNDVHAILLHGLEPRRTDMERQVIFSKALNRIEAALAKLEQQETTGDN